MKYILAIVVITVVIIIISIIEWKTTWWGFKHCLGN